MFGPMRIRRGPSEGDSGYRLPPALARLPADRGRLRRELVEYEQRDRILLAALAVFAAKGFAATTVKDLIEEAAVSRATFYKVEFFRRGREVFKALSSTARQRSIRISPPRACSLSREESR